MIKKLLDLKSFQFFFRTALSDDLEKAEKCIDWYYSLVEQDLADFYAVDTKAFLCVRLNKDNLISPIHIFREEDRNLGLGSKLILYIQRIYQYLSLNVKKDNSRAIHVYQKYNFEIASETPTHLHMIWKKI